MMYVLQETFTNCNIVITEDVQLSVHAENLINVCIEGAKRDSLMGVTDLRTQS